MNRKKAKYNNKTGTEINTGEGILLDTQRKPD
jgi:hypothetical protein